MNGDEGGDELPEEDLSGTYGADRVSSDSIVALIERKTSFRPWHHPVKQIVRERQWAALTKRLIEEREEASDKLRYFTLPGPDLLDVRVLAEVCLALNVKIEYFGFDVNAEASAKITASPSVSAPGPWITAESALRQSGRITAEAIILPDRLEDLAVEQSQAATQLRQRQPFDVINIDACDHLAYIPAGRPHNTFDALRSLLKHQMARRSPWLLFVTTRVQPDLLGQPGVAFQNAVNQNLGLGGDFGQKLAATLGAEETRLAAALASAWSTSGLGFLKIYSIGLGKFLLQFFHGQPNLPANVELASCYTYRVHNEHPDMLALAFRITPDPPRVFEPAVGGAAVMPNLEPARASRVAARAQKLQDLDHALETEQKVRDEAVSGTAALLTAANYDLGVWKLWLSKHEKRPMSVS